MALNIRGAVGEATNPTTIAGAAWNANWAEPWGAIRGATSDGAWGETWVEIFDATWWTTRNVTAITTADATDRATQWS